MYMHRIWLGGKMPTQYAEYGAAWSELNPSYDLVDWTEEMIWDSKWINQDVLYQMYKESQQPGADKIAYYTHVADVVDYELCYTHGGWYFNTDLEPIKPLSALPFFDASIPAFAMEDDTHPVNMAMYSPQNGWLFEKIIDILPKRYWGMPKAFMNATTGVQLIEDALRSYPEHVHFYERNIFNPIHWSAIGYGQEAPEGVYGEETVAVHKWLHRTNQRGQRILE